jgi:GT2 family glycosyltransferase
MACLAVALQIYRLYRISFRVFVLNQNAGFSAVNNLGSALARGRLLLLMNSDVLPDKPGWLGTMTAFYDSTPKIGALGSKLLFEDDSRQHAGLYFVRPLGSSVWEPTLLQGLHRHHMRCDASGTGGDRGIIL